MSFIIDKGHSNEVNIKFLREGAMMPHRGSAAAAGYDLFACIDSDVIIHPGTKEIIGTGLAMTCPHGYYGAIVPRSGMGIKRGLRPANTPGTIDEDYTGEWMIGLYNDSQEDQIIHPGDRIAQVIFIPYLAVEFITGAELEETERGDGKFGSTGM